MSKKQIKNEDACAGGMTAGAAGPKPDVLLGEPVQKRNSLVGDDKEKKFYSMKDDIKKRLEGHLNSMYSEKEKIVEDGDELELPNELESPDIEATIEPDGAELEAPEGAELEAPKEPELEAPKEPEFDDVGEAAPKPELGMGDMPSTTFDETVLDLVNLVQRKIKNTEDVRDIANLKKLWQYVWTAKNEVQVDEVLPR